MDLAGAAGISMVTLSVPFGRSKGMAVGIAVGILTVFNLTSRISRIVIGYLSDRVGRNVLMSLVFFAESIPRLVETFVVLVPISSDT